MSSLLGTWLRKRRVREVLRRLLTDPTPQLRLCPCERCRFWRTEKCLGEKCPFRRERSGVVPLEYLATVLRLPLDQVKELLWSIFIEDDVLSRELEVRLGSRSCIIVRRDYVRALDYLRELEWRCRRLVQDVQVLEYVGEVLTEVKLRATLVPDLNPYTNYVEVVIEKVRSDLEQLRSRASEEGLTYDEARRLLEVIEDVMNYLNQFT